MADGEFVFSPAQGPHLLNKGEVTCGGKCPRFIVRCDIWHSSSDVRVWRILLHAAMARQWVLQNAAAATDKHRKDVAAAVKKVIHLLQSPAVAADQTW